MDLKNQMQRLVTAACKKLRYPAANTSGERRDSARKASESRRREYARQTRRRVLAVGGTNRRRPQ